MGWFDEQIKQRMQSDQEILEDAFFRMASVVLDKWSSDRIEDGRLIAKEALDDILKSYPTASRTRSSSWNTPCVPPA